MRHHVQRVAQKKHGFEWRFVNLCCKKQADFDISAAFLHCDLKKEILFIEAVPLGYFIFAFKFVAASVNMLLAKR